MSDDQHEPFDPFADVAPSDTAGTPAAPLSRREARARAESTGPVEQAQTAPSTPPITRPRASDQPVDRPARTQPEPAAPAKDARDTASVDQLFAAADHINTGKPERRRGRRRGGIVILVIIVALIGALVAGGFWAWNTYGEQIRDVMGWSEPKDYESGIAEGEAVITISSGDLPADVSASLFDAGVTKTSDAFYDYLINESLNPTFFPGVYTLQQKMTSAAALVSLEDPTNRMEHSAALPEGLTVDQSLTRIADGLSMPIEDLTEAVADPSAYGVDAASLEGWLFPATYTFDPGTPAAEIIQTMVNRTRESLDAAQVPVEDRQRILTIASIIQREARYTEDFYKVSRVIENRMQPDNDQTFGKLEMDSTAQYGFGEMHDGTAGSSKEALEDDNLWNTYVHTGLPVGPISNPGDVAIDAAMNPVEGPWMYFVTVDLSTGETVFTSTYAEHLVAVEQWQQWCAANDSEDC